MNEICVRQREPGVQRGGGVGGADWLLALPPAGARLPRPGHRRPARAPRDLHRHLPHRCGWVTMGEYFCKIGRISPVNTHVSQSNLSPGRSHAPCVHKLHFLWYFTQKSLIYSTDEERKLKYFSQFHKFEAKLVSPFPPICSSVCCWVSFDFWKCLESVDKLLHFIGQGTSSRFSRSQSPSSSLHTSGKYLHAIIRIDIYNICYYLQVSLFFCPRELRCIRHKVHIGLFIAFGLADLAWLCQLLCQVSVYIYSYLFIYVSTCLSICIYLVWLWRAQCQVSRYFHISQTNVS